VIPPSWTGKGNGSPKEMQGENDGADELRGESNTISAIDSLAENYADPTRILSISFLRLANLDNGAFKRLNRYETALWRQAVQAMFVLRTIQHK
jgi:hypothetical protein